MGGWDTAFAGSIPENYDRYLGSIYFHHYAEDLAARLVVTPAMRVLETACGTGILTERLVRRLAGHGSVVATDLNESMIGYAKQRRLGRSGLEWQQADATKLPFEDTSFDAVVCQFGLMFFPDKVTGLREALRVLKPGGQYLFSVWDSLEHNAIGRIAHETVASFFPSNPPQFLSVPFSLHDTTLICTWLASVGFQAIEWHTVSKLGVSPTAAAAVIGLVEGTPIHAAIMERRPDALDDIKAAMTRNLAAEFGNQPMHCQLRAFVFSATRPY